MSLDQRKALSANKTSSKRRVAYSLAAGAAAASACGTPDANAAVVYSGPYPINIYQFGALNLDVDGDAIGDLKLKNYVFGGNYQGATVIYAPGNLVLSNNTFPYYVTALTAGDVIGAANTNVKFYGSMAYGANPNSEFQNVTDAFVGFSFPIGGINHFGWVRVDVNNAAGTFLVKDWAYQDVAGRPIGAGQIPEPGTLGLLAAGATGLLALRRRVSKKAK